MAVQAGRWRGLASRRGIQLLGFAAVVVIVDQCLAQIFFSRASAGESLGFLQLGKTASDRASLLIHGALVIAALIGSALWLKYGRTNSWSAFALASLSLGTLVGGLISEIRLGGAPDVVLIGTRDDPIWGLNLTGAVTIAVGCVWIVLYLTDREPSTNGGIGSRHASHK